MNSPDRLVYRWIQTSNRNPRETRSQIEPDNGALESILFSSLIITATTDMFPSNKPFLDCMNRYKHLHIHTGGHADRKGLLEIVDRISPRKIIPIHTDNSKAFEDLFSKYEVLLSEDGQELSCKRYIQNSVYLCQQS